MSEAKLRDYASYVKVYKAFIRHYHLGRFSLQSLDRYLWLVGKNMVP